MNRRGFFGRFLGLVAAPAAIVEKKPEEKPIVLTDLKEHAFEHLPRGKERAVKAMEMAFAANRQGLRMFVTAESGPGCELP